MATVHEIAIAGKHFSTYQPADAQLEGHHDRVVTFGPLPPEAWPLPGTLPDTHPLGGLASAASSWVEVGAAVLVTFADGTTKRAKDLAHEAIAEWRAVLAAKGLI